MLFTGLGRSVLGKTVSEVWSTARGHFVSYSSRLYTALYLDKALRNRSVLYIPTGDTHLTYRGDTHITVIVTAPPTDLR